MFLVEYSYMNKICDLFRNIYACHCKYSNEFIISK